MTNHSEITKYNSLNDIRLKKEAIRKEIDADDAKIQTLWNSLFTKPEILSRNASPSKRLQSLLQVGAGAFDGALLAWKLYRRFKPRKRWIIYRFGERKDALEKGIFQSSKRG
jgi:hypothetical protein